MACPSIVDLQLSEKDREALEAIRKAERNGDWLEKALPVGVLATIFLGNKAPKTSFNIASTDWVLFTQSMNSISTIVRRRVSDIAKMQRLRQGLTINSASFRKL